MSIYLYFGRKVNAYVNRGLGSLKLERLGAKKILSTEIIE